MTQKEAKTGQSVDIVKSTLISPTIVKNILEIPNLKTTLSLIDIGSGDASSSRGVTEALIGKGFIIENLALVDADTKVFPDLIRTVSTDPEQANSTQVLEFKDRDILKAFLELYQEKFDIGIAQMVLHQIPTIQEESYLIHSTYQTLKPNGELFIIDFHPTYIQYLIDHDPNKLKVLQIEDRYLDGIYNFDSGGSVKINSRIVAAQLAMYLGLGFDLVKTVPINTDEIADKKDRYKKLFEEKIPMFYLMQLRKNPANFVSSTTGIVDCIKPDGPKWLTVTFADQDEILIPKFDSWESVQPGSQLVLHETIRPEVNMQIVNYWVIAEDEKITGGQLVASQKQ